MNNESFEMKVIKMRENRFETYKEIREAYGKSICNYRKLRMFGTAKRIVGWVRMMDAIMNGQPNEVEAWLGK